MADTFKYVVGIDLGTTNTLACYFKGGKKKLVDFNGEKMLPSKLYVDKNGKIFVGQVAANLGATDPKNLISSSKTQMGTIEKIFESNGKKFSPTDVATEILKEVRRNFIEIVNCDEDEEIGAVITVPAYFKNQQRNETKKAGEAAGFKVMWILEEPTAAAIESIRDHDKEDKAVFVVDIGGGTFDLSVLKADLDKHIYTPLDTNGDSHLGGDDFDKALVNYFIKQIKDVTGNDLSDFKKSGISDEGEYYTQRYRILTAAQDAKKDLSDTFETKINIQKVFPYYDFKSTLSRDQFNEISKDIYKSIFDRLKRFLNKGDTFKREDIGNVILAGGSCYIPYIIEEVEKIFGYEPGGQDKSMLVAYGAALAAKIITSPEGIGTIEGILSHSFGVMTVNDKHEQIFTKILQKGTKYGEGIICKGTHRVKTTRDNQTKINVLVYEAGHDNEDKIEIKYHDFDGSLELKGIAPQPKGIPTFEITFEFDANQNLKVTVRDEQTDDTVEETIKPGAKPEFPQVVSADVMLMLDNSGSMDSDMETAKGACRRLVNEIIDLNLHRLGLISFESKAELLCHLTQNK
ncbi:MAG: Hsp70 family protein, partial [Selenomonadaceae bacterium]|nr:Hsp70 family protein [Selenomonadaceae bacterium]